MFGVKFRLRDLNKWNVFFTNVPYQFRTITVLQRFLSFVVIRIFSSFTYTHHLSLHSLKLFMLLAVLHCLPYPLRVKFSEYSFLIDCPRNFSCYFLVVSISSHLISIGLKTSSLLTWLVHGILSIHRWEYVSF